jgi:spore maturation protein CgeB
VRVAAAREFDSADGSLCPDALEAEALLLESRAGRRVFYDLDTPVTLERLARGEQVPYIGPRGLSPYDLVLSFSGGASLDQLRSRLGAAEAVPLYGNVDPDVHQPVEPVHEYRCDCRT